MLEAARILASVSVILLIGALVTWMKPPSRQQFRRGIAAASTGTLQIAALLLLAAVGLSAVAATLAIAGWFAA